MEGFISPTGQDWTTAQSAYWEHDLVPRLASIPDLRILEIGVFEGRSAVWFIEHLCLLPEWEYTGLDTFEGAVQMKEWDLSGLEAAARANIAKAASESKVAGRATVLKGRSRDILPGLRGWYDLVYVDASHEYEDVRQDLPHAERLCRPGGFIMCDDWDWPGVARAVAERWGLHNLTRVRQLILRKPPELEVLAQRFGSVPGVSRGATG